MSVQGLALYSIFAQSLQLRKVHSLIPSWRLKKKRKFRPGFHNIRTCTQEPLCFQRSKTNTLHYWIFSVSGICFRITGVNFILILSWYPTSRHSSLAWDTVRGMNAWRQMHCFQNKTIQLIIKQLSALKYKICSCWKFHSELVTSSLNWIFLNYMAESRKGLQKH